ncbi:hypothetical protein D9613_007256 [Agrocybe pediades]|uniref:Flavodoxin-like domain-containing protein n=1 Tax=Agrocybe pediades TaxID=84607 RepID=A0A8H4QGZ3_9AGAR|nr:hypothetical protein D9613_007256 [Agrocybe pediades]
MSSPKIAIVIYTMFGHIGTMAEAVKNGIKKAGGDADIYQVAETLPEEVLVKMKASPKPDYPIATPDTLTKYDAYMFGIPTRYGNMPAQFKTFWDATGQLWVKGSLSGKYAGVFVSTSSLGGGQEMTPLTLMSTLVHHGIIFVPLGYASGLNQLGTLEEAHGGSAWGAGTLAGPNFSRQPSQREINIAECHGEHFYKMVSRVKVD